MTDFVVHYQAWIRELINGSAMILFLTLTTMVGVFMWDTMVEYTRGKVSARRSWQHAPGIPTACALWWVFAAETYRTGAVWALYQLGKKGNDASVFFESGTYWSSYGYLLAGIALNGGLLRAIYIFTPPDWKSKVWLYASLAAMLFCMSPTLYVNLKEYITHGL